MSLDQRLRDASNEINEAVGRRRGTLAFDITRRRHQGRRVLAASAAAILTVVVSVAALTLGRPAAPMQPPAASNATTMGSPATMSPAPTSEPPASSAATAAPSTAPGGDGLSGEWTGSDEWLAGLDAAAVVLLLEDGIGLAAVPASDAGGEGWSLLMTAAGSGRRDPFLAIDSWDEIPEVRMGMVRDGSDDMVTVFGWVPLGSSAVRIEVSGVEPAQTDRVYDRPEVERSVFIGEIELPDMTSIGSGRMQVAVTDAAGDVTEFTLDGSGVPPTDGDGGALTVHLFHEQQPLVVGSTGVDQVPTAVTCQVPEGVEAPPNRNGSPAGSIGHDTPEAALEGFIAERGEDLRLATSGYVELAVTDGDDSVIYGQELLGGDGYVTVISVVRTDTGWAVDTWEASGC